jgi:hypothetical protein
MQQSDGGSAMTAAVFQVGERVKLRSATGIVCAGTVGTVERAFRFIDAYDVQFDGHTGVQFVWGRNLERVMDESEKTP